MMPSLLCTAKFYNRSASFSVCKSLQGRLQALQRCGGDSEATWVVLNYCCIELNDALVGSKMDLCAMMGWFSGTVEQLPCSLQRVREQPLPLDLAILQRESANIPHSLKRFKN